jgi:hypothetical protein
MIHINQVRSILKSKQPFSCLVWKKNGDILRYNDVVCTSTFFENDTANLKFIQSGQVRKVIIITIFEINDEEVII